MHYQDRLMDLLDRQFKLVNESPPADFLLEVERFVNFIMRDETLEYYVPQLEYEFERQRWEHEKALNEIKAQLSS
jgi:hypothetical protein